MKKIIEIKNIKSIKKLKFIIPEGKGVHVLTGINGAGKTTLMTCLLRIGQGRAYRDHFKTGSGTLDGFDGTIEYILENNQSTRSVIYRHSGKRWPPTPKANSGILSEFGYSEVRFLPATGQRLFVNDNDLNPRSIRGVDEALKNDMNTVLETTRFNDLRYIQTGNLRGPGGDSHRWKRAYILKVGRKYYSEKNFSLGELLVLNTLLLIEDIQEGAMLLIDELEMALHPKIQRNLLQYLERKAQEKNIMIIFSTHSSSLIKCAKRLIYLEGDSNNEIKVIHNCYPSVALREIAIDEEVQPDFLFLVEDDMAFMLFTEILRYYGSINVDKYMPIMKIMPIGGYSNVLEFLDRSQNYLFRENIKQFIFFDEDVIAIRDGLVAQGNRRSATENILFEKFNRFSNNIFYLPITPELGLWNWIINDVVGITTKLNVHYNDSIPLRSIIEEVEQTFANTPETDNGEERKKAKRRIKLLLDKLSNRLNIDKQRILNHMYYEFVKEWYTDTDEVNRLKGILGRIFNS